MRKIIKEVNKNVHDGLLERESGDNGGMLQSEPVSETEKERDVERESGEFGKNVSGENGKHVQHPETAEASARQLTSGDNDNRIRESDKAL